MPQLYDCTVDSAALKGDPPRMLGDLPLPPGALQRPDRTGPDRQA
jgi:hypothetical protein